MYLLICFWHLRICIDTHNRDEQPPRLKRFMGRPKDMSPKARLLWLMGCVDVFILVGSRSGAVTYPSVNRYNPPFDRHDWVVERPDGTEVRYVLDFYAGQIDPKAPKPVAMHLDVRPALDSFDVRGPAKHIRA